jgi:hypothetical protein
MPEPLIHFFGEITVTSSLVILTYNIWRAWIVVSERRLAHRRSRPRLLGWIQTATNRSSSGGGKNNELTPVLVPIPVSLIASLLALVGSFSSTSSGSGAPVILAAIAALLDSFALGMARYPSYPYERHDKYSKRFWFTGWLVLTLAMILKGAIRP